MRTVWQKTGSSHLMVFLPGKKDSPETFLQKGFPDALKDAGIPADWVLVDAHLGYYYKRTFLERLNEDVLLPAREMGYEHIWVVGVSLGGLGAVLTEFDQPGTWDGIVLMAPFPGDKKAVFDTIRKAPNLSEVVFETDDLDDDYTAKFWIWMQQYQANPRIPLLLGYGQQDGMEAEQALIVEILPDGRVWVIPGGHNWTVWQALWHEMLPAIRSQL